jgi:aspartokinase
MTTISNIVQKIVREKPFLEEALAKGLINYASLAENIQNEIEKELSKKVKLSAVVMALRRLAEKLETELIKKTSFQFKETDVTIKSDLVEFTVQKSATVINSIRKVYDSVDFSKGDFLTMTQGVYEITLIFNKKYKNKFAKIFEEEKIIKTIAELASVTIKIPIDVVETVGFFYIITKALNWENINIIEIVSTLTELTFIVKEDDAPRAFKVLKELVSSQ